MSVNLDIVNNIDGPDDYEKYVEARKISDTLRQIRKHWRNKPNYRTAGPLYNFLRQSEVNFGHHAANYDPKYKNLDVDLITDVRLPSHRYLESSRALHKGTEFNKRYLKDKHLIAINTIVNAHKDDIRRISSSNDTYARRKDTADVLKKIFNRNSIGHAIECDDDTYRVLNPGSNYVTIGTPELSYTYKTIKNYTPYTS